MVSSPSRYLSKLFFNPIPIFQGRYAHFFLEYRLEIGLTGKMEIAADLTQGQIGVPQQTLGVAYLAARYVLPHGHAGFPPEFFGQPGAAFPDMLRHVVHAQADIGVVLNMIHGLGDPFRQIRRQLGKSHPFRKIKQHIVL